MIKSFKNAIPCEYSTEKEIVEYKKVNFVKAKIFKNGAKQLTVKGGFTPKDEENKQKLKRNKQLKAIFRYRPKDIELQKISKKANLFNYSQVNSEYTAKQEELNTIWVNAESIRVSTARTRKEVYDLFLCNEFQFFITVTFNKTSVKNRLDDDETRSKFSKWLNNLHTTFPNAIYIAVPEHHKKGGLHFHLVLGNVTAEELKLRDSGHKVKSGKTAGDIIYNITRWRNGWSTATYIRNVNATKKYIMKYISKQNNDISFHGKKRYWASKNLERPDVRKITLDFEESIPLGYDYDLVYRDSRREYLVFENDKFIHL